MKNENDKRKTATLAEVDEACRNLGFLKAVNTMLFKCDDDIDQAALAPLCAESFAKIEALERFLASVPFEAQQKAAA